MDLELHQPAALTMVPDGMPLAEALARTTHLGVAAHQDDLEILAFHGIAACFGQADRWFTGVVATDGAGSPRAGRYASYTDVQMRQVRRREQVKAAVAGEYGAILQLDYPSSLVKSPRREPLVEDLVRILRLARPRVIYTHNLADKHLSHAGVTLALVEALRRLPPERQPEAFYGCEVWRDLDWLPDNVKVRLDVSGSENLAAALLGVFDSQISGGKRYDLAVQGRRRAHATFLASHATDEAEALIFAMDLRPLLTEPGLTPREFVIRQIQAFQSDVTSALSSLG